MTDNIIKPSDDFQYYVESAIYWNDFPEVRARMNAWITGDATIDWIGHLRDKHGVRDRALMVSCGNGWVERELFQRDVIKSAFGFDVMPSLVETARQEAKNIGLPATYEMIDANNISLAERGFNIAVNNGSVHHIAFIDRMLRWLRASIADDGIYVIFDYTGPHRNQYDWETWSSVIAVNRSLPEKYRIRLDYPHMPTMLAMDPTEAIHSKLQMGVTRRYFEVQEEVRLGGGVAYTLLFGNRTLFNERETSEGRVAIQMILHKDEELLSRNPQSNLFTFAVCRPKEDLGPDQQALLDKWEAEEVEREARAAANGGRYYRPDALEIIYNELVNLRDEVKALRS